MNDLSLYLVLAAILGQGIFLLIVLRFLPDRNKSVNNMLSLLLLISCVVLLGRIVVGYSGINGLWPIGIFVDGSIFVFGPLLYAYVRRLLLQEFPVFRLKWIHYAPVMIYLLYFAWLLILPQSVKLEYSKARVWIVLFELIEGLGIVSMSFYIIKSFVLLKRSKHIDQDQIPVNLKASRFLNFLLLALSIFTSLWLINFVNVYYLERSFKYLSYNAMWISVGGLMYVIGFYSLVKPEVFRVHKSKRKANPSNVHRLSEKEIENLKEKLRIKLEEEQLFLDSKLSLITLSKAIGTTTNNLSWLLNNVYEKKFYEFINEYRVKAFLELIKKNQHKNSTFYALARDVGFNSKSTFNKAFKSMTKQTPSNYIKQLETR
jgi:AraC-like DNA-binding protein